MTVRTRLAVGERQPRPNLEDREVVLNEPSQRCASLVVGAVRFEDHRYVRRQARTQMRGLPWHVLEQLGVRELHARLSDHRTHSMPRRFRTRGSERQPRYFDRLVDIVRGADVDAVLP